MEEMHLRGASKNEYDFLTETLILGTSRLPCCGKPRSHGEYM